MSDEKKAYEEKYQAKLDEWRAEIDKLSAKARQSSADARIRYQEEIEKLKKRRSDAETRLEEMRKSSGEAWRDLKGGADNAWDEVERAFKQAMTRFR
jgi:predicted nuclease with TOPRIM domain